MVDKPYQKHLYPDFVRTVLIIWLKMSNIYFWAVLNLMILGEILQLVVSTRISIELMIFLLNTSGYSGMKIMMYVRKIARLINLSFLLRTKL